MCIRVSVYVCAFVSPAFREILKKRNILQSTRKMWFMNKVYWSFSIFSIWYVQLYSFVKVRGCLAELFPGLIYKHKKVAV